MATAYDTYNYTSYWKERRYEHQAEVIALKGLLEKVPKINTIIDIGAGFGRLTPTYLHRSEKVILLDPSDKLLKLAKQNINNRKVTFLRSKLENLSKNFKNSADFIILVRVLHHVKDLDKALSIINKICRKKGFFLLEFPNKRHFKATLLQFAKGNFTFPIDIFPKDISTKNIKNCLPFVNYHPDFIKQKLKENGFKIIEARSVSNIRNPFLKRFLPQNSLLFLEKYAQKYLSCINFGPSIFVLSRKI